MNRKIVNYISRLSFVSVIAVVLLAGTQKIVARYFEIDLFKLKHPNETKNYKLLACGSPEFAEWIESQYLVAINGIIRGVQKRKDNPEELDSYLKRVQCKIDKSRITSFPEWKRIKELCQKDGMLVYFDYRTRKYGVAYSDSGFLILKDGEIIYRWPFIYTSIIRTERWTPEMGPVVKLC